MNAVPRLCHPCRRLGEKDSEKDSLIRWKKDALQIIKFFSFILLALEGGKVRPCIVAQIWDRKSFLVTFREQNVSEGCLESRGVG